MVDAAKVTGIGGFVIDYRKNADGTHGRDADVFAGVATSEFEFGCRWWNETTPDPDRQRSDAEAAMGAMGSCAAMRSQNRVVVVNATDISETRRPSSPPCGPRRPQPACPTSR